MSSSTIVAEAPLRQSEVAVAAWRRDPVAPPGQRRRLAQWLRARRLSLLILAVTLLVIGAVNVWNLHGWPARDSDDEGTYVAQAWAMLARGDIAHYTYWYDHPFLGWAMIAGYAWLTDGFVRLPSGVMVGREFMVIMTVVTCALLFLLARRLRLHRAAAVGVVALFGLSPLAIYFHRMVFLDNIAVMWTVAALATAASRRRSLAASFWCAVFFACAVLSKETFALLLPAVVWMLLQHTDKRTRPWNLGVFVTSLVSLVAAYPIFALLKNELIPGGGHVSLVSAVWWQLFGRSGSGSLLDPDSLTRGLTMSWLHLDSWLLVAGIVVLPFGFYARRSRPVALAFLFPVGMMLRGGYVPTAYVIGLLPFAAILVGCTLDALAGRLGRLDVSRPIWVRRFGIRRAWIRRVWVRRAGVGRVWVRRARWTPLVAILAAFGLFGGTAWVGAIIRESHVDGSANSRAATAWVIDNVDRDAVVVTDDYIWLDLTLAHFTKPVWLYKIDGDPQVMKEDLPAGYASIDYLVMPALAPATLDTLPTIRKALSNSTLIRTFGALEVRRVVAPLPRP
jgi:hypothetical protein